MASVSRSSKLTLRELRFLKLMYPEGSIAFGLSFAEDLAMRGYLMVSKQNGQMRYRLTRLGIIAVAASAAMPSQSAPVEPASD